MECRTDVTGFDFVAAAPSYSALTGVIAGLIFTGLVLIVGQRPEPDSTNKRQALLLLLPAFLAMLLASLLYGVVAGEGVCQRGNAEAAMASAIFAVAAIATILAIAWLIHSFDPSSVELNSVCGWSVFAFTELAYLQLAAGYYDPRFHYGASPSFQISIWVIAGVGMTAVAAVFVRWLTGRSSAARTGQVAAFVGAYVALNAVAFSLLTVQTGPRWERAVPPLYTVLAYLSMTVFVPVTVALVGTLPPRVRREGR